MPIVSKTDEGVRYHEHDFWELRFGVWIQRAAVLLPLKGQAPYAVAIRKSAIPVYINALQKILVKTATDSTRTQRYLAKEAYKKTVPHALPANLTTKTCRRMYSHIATTTPPPPAGAPQI